MFFSPVDSFVCLISDNWEESGNVVCCTEHPVIDSASKEANSLRMIDPRIFTVRVKRIDLVNKKYRKHDAIINQADNLSA